MSDFGYFEYCIDGVGVTLIVEKVIEICSQCVQKFEGIKMICEHTDQMYIGSLTQLEIMQELTYNSIDGIFEELMEDLGELENSNQIDQNGPISWFMNDENIEIEYKLQFIFGKRTRSKRYLSFKWNLIRQQNYQRQHNCNCFTVQIEKQQMQSLEQQIIDMFEPRNVKQNWKIDSQPLTQNQFVFFPIQLIVKYSQVSAKELQTIINQQIQYVRNCFYLQKIQNLTQQWKKYNQLVDSNRKLRNNIEYSDQVSLMTDLNQSMRVLEAKQKEITSFLLGYLKKIKLYHFKEQEGTNQYIQ